MHQLLVIGAACIDHDDRNGLNNQDDNLLPSNYSANGHNRLKQSNNTSGHKNVCRAYGNLRWRAVVRNKDREITRYFKTKQEAIEAVPGIRKELGVRV